MAAALLVAVGSPAIAVGGDEPPDLVELMRKADAAARQVRAVAYDVEYFATGELATRVPHVTGRVIGRQARVGFFAEIANRSSDKPAPCLRFTGTYKIGEGVAKAFDIGTDGRQVFSIDAESKQLIEGSLEQASSLIDSFKPLFMLEFFHPTPFHDEITANLRRHEGVVEIDGVECDVVYVEYRRKGFDARWYIARKDSLPRRVDRLIFRGEKAIGQRVLIVTNLDTHPLIQSDTFRPAPPDGYERRAFAAPPARAPLRAGAEAPDFELRTPEGKAVRLSSLRGNVVVLDFWATWCVPCRISMPQLQSLHEKFADQPVRVIGLSCWEKGDPAKMMKAGGMTYQLLIDADRVAADYGVNDIPTVFVIDPEGVIRYSYSGFVPTLEHKLERAVRKALPVSDNK